ncbi:hypothetical protein I6G82_08590 [Lysinibacillus macroides]|uniref:Uncharacterized protein n=1 Tax=Lysinibacillus macroides TaxID=33935 RepID=A0A0M9DJA9_9BACI|nr:hypothetical protein [Lysinibacillus macroides]KOY81540.1 hypothetical protein ADM90_14105 [Lysinibacillus macroides]QPR69625.1 hypothetical protein I6G82_08590 [Lysinibacillus macroides]
MLVNGTDFITITLSKEEVIAITEDLQRALWYSEEGSPCGDTSALSRKLHAQFELLSNQLKQIG